MLSESRRKAKRKDKRKKEEKRKREKVAEFNLKGTKESWGESKIRIWWQGGKKKHKMIFLITSLVIFFLLLRSFLLPVFLFSLFLPWSFCKERERRTIKKLNPHPSSFCRSFRLETQNRLIDSQLQTWSIFFPIPFKHIRRKIRKNSNKSEFESTSCVRKKWRRIKKWRRCEKRRKKLQQRRALVSSTKIEESSLPRIVFGPWITFTVTIFRITKTTITIHNLFHHQNK